MEKSKYLIQDPTLGKNTRSYEQRTNDMNALSFLTVIYTDDGSDTKSKLVAVKKFFDEKQYLSAWNDGGMSASMRKNLIKIQKNWNRYKDSNLIKYIANYVSDKMSKLSNQTNDNNQWVTFKKFYTNDKNRAYFSFEKLFADIANGDIEDEAKVIEEFDTFTQSIEKSSGLKNEEENS